VLTGKLVNAFVDLTLCEMKQSPPPTIGAAEPDSLPRVSPVSASSTPLD
jgi:hypothetical protein